MKNYKTALLSNNKGGVGKSLYTFLIANIFVKKYNKKVLLIDVDEQKSMETILRGQIYDRDDNLFLPDIFMTAFHDSLNNTHHFKTALTLDRFVHRTEIEGLYLIKNDSRIKGLATFIQNINNKDKIMSKWLEYNNDILNEYDYIFFDNASQLDDINKNVVLAVDSLSFVTTPDLESIEGIERYIASFMHWTEEDDSKIDVFKGIFLANIKPNTTVAKNFISYVKNDDYQLSPFIFNSIIENATIFERVKLKGELFARKENPKSYDELIKLVDELLEAGVY